MEPDETGFELEGEEFMCPITGGPCRAAEDGWLCEDYGCILRHQLTGSASE